MLYAVSVVCVHGVIVWLRRVSWWKICVCYSDVFSLVYLYFDQLLFCVVCVDGLAYVYVCESYVVLDECDEPPLCLCSLSVRMVV